MSVKDRLPLSETSFFILLSLVPRPKHGYGMIKDVEVMSAGRVVLAAGTLYSALRRMLEDGWIERVAEQPPGNDTRERKLYRLTDLGRQIFELESERLQGLARLIARRKALENS